MGSSPSKNAPLEKGIRAALDNDDNLYAFPSDALYQIRDVKPYNLDWPFRPAAITYPKTTAQVAAIVRCAVEAKLKVQARGGGHSYANYCKSPLDPIGNMFHPKTYKLRHRWHRWSRCH